MLPLNLSVQLSADRVHAGCVAALQTCGGTGQKYQPCGACGGDGRVRRTKRISLRVPPGVDSGSRLRVRGEVSIPLDTSTNESAARRNSFANPSRGGSIVEHESSYSTPHGFPHAPQGVEHVENDVLNSGPSHRARAPRHALLSI
eukprot:882035-Prorocentrum_minimum.AAC.1